MLNRSVDIYKYTLIPLSIKIERSDYFRIKFVPNCFLSIPLSEITSVSITDFDMITPEL